MKLIHKGILITIVEEYGTYSAYFSSTPNNYEELHYVGPLKNFVSIEEAAQASVSFVEEHQWQHIASIGIAEVFVRLWYCHSYGYSYSVLDRGGMYNRAGFDTFEDAKNAGISYALLRNTI